MTKEDVLINRGFEPGKWEFMEAGTALKYLAHSGSVKNMFPVDKRAEIAEFGSGCYIVSKQWIFDTIDKIDNSQQSGVPMPPATDTVKVEVPKVPNAPSISGLTIPQPPKVETKEFTCDKYDNTGEYCKEQCAFCKEADGENIDLAQHKEQKKAELASKTDELVSKIDVNEPELVKGVQDGKEVVFEKITVQPPETPIFVKGELEVEEIEEVEDWDDDIEVELPSPDVKGSLDVEDDVIPLNPDGSVDTSNMEEADAVEAILEHQGVSAKGKAVGTLTARKTEDVIAEQEDAFAPIEQRIKILEANGFVRSDKTFMHPSKVVITTQELHLLNDEQFDSKMDRFREAIASYEESLKTREERKEQKETFISVPTGFFKRLTTFGFQQLNLSFTMSGKEIIVIVKTNNFSGDSAYDDLKPLQLKGTAEELDNGFFDAIGTPLKTIHGMLSNAEEYMKQAKELEKETKKAKDKADRVKKMVESAEKYMDKDFDFKDANKVKTATKKWNEVLEEDPDNKKAKDGLETLKKNTNGQTGTLNL